MPWYHWLQWIYPSSHILQISTAYYKDSWHKSIFVLSFKSQTFFKVDDQWFPAMELIALILFTYVSTKQFVLLIWEMLQWFLQWFVILCAPVAFYSSDYC